MFKKFFKPKAKLEFPPLLFPNVRVAVLTHFVSDRNTVAYPGEGAENGRKWDYYDECLQRVCSVDYYNESNWKEITGYDIVLVNDSLDNEWGDDTVLHLKTIKSKNARIHWIELHEKVVYSAACFLPEFWDTVDLVLKHQLVEFDILKETLANPSNCLAAYRFYGVSDLRSFWNLKDYFNYRMPDDLIGRHLSFDWESVAERIQPLMYPFSSKVFSKGALPYYRENVSNRGQSGNPSVVYCGRGNRSHIHRLSLVSLLVENGINVTVDDDYERSLTEYDYSLGIGLLHSSLRTFDTLAYPTVLVHYNTDSHKMWPEFKAYENFLPIGDPLEIFSKGCFGFQKDYVESVVVRFKQDLNDTTLRLKLLREQRKLFDQLTNPLFVVSKLGLGV